MQSKIRSLSILNLVVLAIHISISYATQLKLVNTKDAGEVSNQYTSLFTPAAITFAIWGVIYIALTAFCIYHIIMAFTYLPYHSANQDIHRIGAFFIFNNLAAAAWLLAWTHQHILYALVIIFFQLFTLIIIHLQTGIHNPSQPPGSKIFTQFPLSIYLGWISIAAIANTAVYLTMIKWDGFGSGYSAITWTRIMIAFAVFITLTVVLFRRNVFFGLVVLWALYGIISKLKNTNASAYTEIIQTAWIGMVIVGLVCIIQFVKNVSTGKKQPRFPEAGSIK